MLCQHFHWQIFFIFSYMFCDVSEIIISVLSDTLYSGKNILGLGIILLDWIYYSGNIYYFKFR